MDADKKKENGTIVLTPFEVSTAKDRGYAAGNMLAGGRIDQPLDLAPSSIQVMTKEFMDDFAITDFADAAKWTVNVDVPEGNDAPFGGSRFEYNTRGAGGGGNYPIREGIPQFFVANNWRRYAVSACRTRASTTPSADVPACCHTTAPSRCRSQIGLDVPIRSPGQILSSSSASS